MKYWFAAVIVSLLLSACGELPSRDRGPQSDLDFTNAPDPVPRSEPRSKYGNNPYQVAGVNYRVMQSASGYVERGLASWYGMKFHGQYTSNREIYNMYAMTAAHRTLPLPTYVRVTNLANHRSCIVRVNDRGPFHSDRIIDLSYAAASKLGIVQTGTAMVEVRAIDPNEPGNPETVVTAQPGFRTEPSLGLQPIAMEPMAPAVAVNTTTSVNADKPSDADTGPLYAQAGAFASRANAESLRDRLHNENLPVDIQESGSSKGVTLYLVRVGPFTNKAEAERTMGRLQELGVRMPHLIQVQR